jgi:hypothetical protein
MLVEITSARGKIASERKLAMDATRREKVIWLCAMLEAEGTFSFQYNEQVKNGKLHSHIQPLVIFVNSDMALVDRVHVVIAELGFVPYRGRPKTSGLGKKKKAEVTCNGFKSLPLLKMLRPYMVGEKTECVDCLIRFIEYRQHLQSIGKPKKIYSDVEFALLRRVREINSGHWRQAPKFSQISTEAVSGRRDAVASRLRLVV